MRAAVAGAGITAGALAAALALGLLRLGGAETYVTDPLATTALAAAAVAIVALGVLRSRAGDTGLGAGMLALGASLVLYLAFGALATAAVDGGWSSASMVVGVWGAWWMVPHLVIPLVALRGVPRARAARVALLVIGVLGLVGTALLSEPEAPFGGLPTAAPEGWASSDVLGALAAALFAALLVAPVLLALRIRRSTGPARRAVLARLAAAGIPPLLVVICVGLAVARNPGDVDPETGSVGYLVALGVACLLAALALTTSEGASSRVAVHRALGAVLAGWATALGLLGGTWLVALLARVGSLVSALAIAVLAVALAAGWWAATRALGRLLHVEPAGGGIPSLSRRESDVLALVADGLRDADIAARLHLSERTVESHVRNIFRKLGLEADDGANRRVLAARSWVEAHNSGLARISAGARTD